MYLLQVTDAEGTPLSKPQLQKQLQSVISMGDAAAGGTLTPPVGVLTSQDRDIWADARAQLVVDGNEEQLRDVSGLIDGRPYSRFMFDAGHET